MTPQPLICHCSHSRGAHVRNRFFAVWEWCRYPGCTCEKFEDRGEQ